MEDTLALVDLLAPLGVDVVDCSSGGNNPAQKIVVKPGYQVDFAQQVKAKHPQLTVAAVGLITEPKQANDIVEQGQGQLQQQTRIRAEQPRRWCSRSKQRPKRRSARSYKQGSGR